MGWLPLGTILAPSIWPGGWAGDRDVVLAAFAAAHPSRMRMAIVWRPDGVAAYPIRDEVWVPVESIVSLAGDSTLSIREARAGELNVLDVVEARSHEPEVRAQVVSSATPPVVPVRFHASRYHDGRPLPEVKIVGGTRPHNDEAMNGDAAMSAAATSGCAVPVLLTAGLALAAIAMGRG